MGRFNEVVCQAGAQRIVGGAMQDYLMNDSFKNAAKIWQSGVVQRSERATQFALGGNDIGTVAFWLPPDYSEGGIPNCADTDGIDSGTECDAIGLNSGTENLFKLYVNKKFAMDYCETQCLNSTEDDPITIVIEKIAGPEMVRQYSHKLMSQLVGLYAHAAARSDADEYVVDLGQAVLDRATSVEIEDLREYGSFDGILVHRDVYRRMKRDAFLSEKVCCEHTGYEYDSFNGETKVISVGKEFGDLYFKDADGAYISYAFKDGAVEYGEGAHPKPFQLWENPDANCNDGSEFAYFRSVFVARPFGTDFTGNPAKDYANNAELQDATNWNIKVPSEHFNMAFVKSNAPAA
jgi:hypothetical protein